MKFLDDEIVKLTSNMINYVKGFFETPANLDGEDFEIEKDILLNNQYAGVKGFDRFATVWNQDKNINVENACI